MADPSLFGIGKAQWDLVNSFANWFAAAGSFAAAGAALYLANRASKPSASVSVGHRIVIGPGIQKPYPEFAVFRIVNTGDRPIRVVQIGWTQGVFRKRHAIQLYDETQSSRLPIELTHGQEATWMVPFSFGQESWPEYFTKGFLSPHRRVGLWTLRAHFHTSVGYVFSVKPEENLLQPLRDVCEKLKLGK